eukprot:766024-Hanusia_phi.AAC.2
MLALPRVRHVDHSSLTNSLTTGRTDIAGDPPPSFPAVDISPPSDRYYRSRNCSLYFSAL